MEGGWFANYLQIEPQTSKIGAKSSNVAALGLQTQR